VASYEVLIKASAVKELEAIGQKKDRQRLARRISALGNDPRPPRCRKLSGDEERCRVRQGQHRIVYAVDDGKRTVTVFKIGHRKAVYR
jgi:mRNA interferase RelE/StbE